MANKKNWLKKLLTAISCFALTVTAGATALIKTEGITASAATYITGANAVSSSYKSGRYYTHFSNITLTGDGVTDVLAVALSQLGYQEGESDGKYSGETAGSNNYTEYCYNMGNFGSGYGGSDYPWCAAFVSWALLQSKVTTQNTMGAWCRKHEGDIDYIWREISCSAWANQLQRFSGYYGARGSYTPKSGDLIFFNSGSTIGHIGIVVWCDGSKVYTIEGNTSSGTGLEANGGGVYYKSYNLTSTYIHGYGRLPYPTNASAPKVDYTGANKTAGQYITNAKVNVSSTAGGTTSFTIPQYYTFNVTGFSGSYAIVEYNGSTGYVKLNSDTIQISALTNTEVKVEESAVATTYHAGGTKIPEDYRQDPNVLISGMSETVNHYWGLENYGNNKDLILINGRTWSKWEARDANALARLWVRGAGDGKLYLGLDLNDTSKLRLKTQTGVGEELKSIVLKRGFQFVNTTSNQWENDNAVYENSPAVSGVIGTLTDNVVLLVNDDGGFDVSNGTTTVTTSGTTQYGTVTGSSVNVRSGPSTSDEIYGVVYAGDKLVYLEETSAGWYKVSYNGKTAWISGTYFTLTGYETITEITPMTIDGYTVKKVQDVVVTGDVLLAKTPAVVSATEAWKMALKGETYTYLGEMSDRWYKVDYNGNVGWISNNYSTLSDEYVTITALNADWPEDVTPRHYDIISVYVYTGASRADQVTFLFSNAEKTVDTTVHLGYTDWDAPDEDTTAFMQYIKVNGAKVTEAFPDATLEGLDQRAGLSLKNVSLNEGDVVSIDQGATFEHEGVSMTMQYQFMLTWNGTKFVASKTQEEIPSDSSADSSVEGSVVDSSIDGEVSSEDSVVDSGIDSAVSSEDSVVDSGIDSAVSSEDSVVDGSIDSAVSSENSVKDSSTENEDDESCVENSSEDSVTGADGSVSQDDSSSKKAEKKGCASSFGGITALLFTAGFGLAVLYKKGKEEK